MTGKKTTAKKPAAKASADAAPNFDHSVKKQPVPSKGGSYIVDGDELKPNTEGKS